MRKERGMALLTVLLMTATLAVLAVAMTDLITRSVRRAMASEARDQAYWALYGLEAAAIDRLKQQNEALSDPTGALFREPVVIPFEGSIVTVRFRDLSNCFNLNDLVDGDDEGFRADAGAMERFSVLIQALGGTKGGGLEMAARIADFMDSDQQPETGGVEDYDYSRREVPYRTAKGFLASVSEIRAIAGFSRDIYVALEPRLCVLPSDGPQLLNVNSLTPEDAPTLVAAMGGALPLASAERVLEQRPPQGYNGIDDFLEAPGLANADLPADMASLLAVESQLIEMEVVMQSPTGRLRQVSILRVGNGAPEVIERRLGERLP